MTRVYRPSKATTGRTFQGKKKGGAVYDFAWQKYRRRFLNTNSNCYACGKPANIVDHLVPHQGNVELFEKLDNHIPLCETCHNTVTGLFDRAFKRGGPIEPKLKWLARERAARNLTFPVKVLPSYRSER